MRNPATLDTFGKRLAYLRTVRAKINQQKLSDKTGISRSNLSKYEHDKIKPTADAIVALCDFFKVTADWLLRGVDSQTPANTPSSDLELEMMTEVLKKLMASDDPDLQGWTKVQFREAFKRYCPSAPETSPRRETAR